MGGLTSLKGMKTPNKTELRLGIDIGRVIIGGDARRGDTSFFSGSDVDAMDTPEVPGAIETIARLSELFGRRVWLVSKCGPKVQARTRQWLRHHDFWGRSGVPQTNLRFCLERRDKAIHCRQNRLTHFIDDRTDVLGHLEGVVEHRYLFGPQRPGTVVPAAVVPVHDWRAVGRVFGLLDRAVS